MRSPFRRRQTFAEIFADLQVEAQRQAQAAGRSARATIFREQIAAANASLETTREQYREQAEQAKRIEEQLRRLQGD